MDEHDDALGERLLLEWHIKHELVQFYSTALQRLMPSDPDAQRRRGELSARLSAAMIRLTQVSDQLQAHERERVSTRLSQP